HALALNDALPISFSKEKPEEYRSPDIRGWRGYQAFHACALASTSRLAQAQFSDQRPDSFAFHQARWRSCAAALSENPRTRSMHYLDRARFVFDSNARS